MGVIVIDSKAYIKDREGNSILTNTAHSSLSDLSGHYPHFDEWFLRKVEPGIMSGERKILLQYTNKILAGIAILKSTSDEKKICCLRVMPKFYGSGVGVRLFSECFLQLETDRPLLSVSEERLPEFDRIFKHFSFEVGDRYKDIYRLNKSETSFNGLLIRRN